MEANSAFTDNDLFTLIDSETTRSHDKEKKQLEAEHINNILWDAIERLDTPVVSSRDSSQHDDLYAKLIQTIRANMDEDDDYASELEKDEHISDIADSYWILELRLLTQLSIYMHEQYFPESATLKPDVLKKTFMAQLRAEGIESDEWFTLIDNVLTGDRLDETRAEDFEIMTIALERFENRESSPPYELYQRLLSVLNIPDEVDDDIDESVLTFLRTQLDLAHQITELTIYMAGKAHQADRHAAIHALARKFQFDDTSLLNEVLAVADQYKKIAD